MPYSPVRQPLSPAAAPVSVAVSYFGPADTPVSNAGIANVALSYEMPVALWDQMFAVGTHRRG